MSDPIRIQPDPVFSLPDGRTFSLDVIEACLEIDRISEETRGRTDYAYVERFVAWAERAAGVKLKPAQADQVIKFVLLERARQGNEFTASLDALRPSWPSSTAAPPSPSDGETDLPSG